MYLVHLIWPDELNDMVSFFGPFPNEAAARSYADAAKESGALSIGIHPLVTPHRYIVTVKSK